MVSTYRVVVAFNPVLKPPELSHAALMDVPGTLCGLDAKQPAFTRADHPGTTTTTVQCKTCLGTTQYENLIRVGAMPLPCTQWEFSAAAYAAVEDARRQRLWEALPARGSPEAVEPRLLRDLRIYGGAGGVWVDAETTRHVVPGGPGVAVGLLHTGRHYPDAIDEDGVIYHYPDTNRPRSRDEGEIESIRAAGRLRLPMFFIEQIPGGLRRVRRSWLESDDPAARSFYLAFDEQSPHAFTSTGADSDNTFSLDDAQADQCRQATQPQRDGQTRFRFDVFKRYGAACVACGLAIDEMLEAAHLKPRSQRGTNDARNGLPFCRNHHRAFDQRLFGIDPASIEVHARSDGACLSSLRIDPTVIRQISNRPHQLALNWAWARFSSGTA